MYFHSVHGKNIQLSQDSSQAKRVRGFCQGITFSSNPLTPLQRVTFLVGNESADNKYSSNTKQGYFKRSSKKSIWNGNLRIGLTSKNPITLTSSDLPEFSYPTLLNTEGYWITVIKSSYLKHGNKLSLVLDKNNSLQLAINYVVKATLFANDMIPSSPSNKLWLILDLYGSTNKVQFLPSDDTPYEIKARGLDAVNNFHSACLSGGSRSIYKTRLLLLGQDGVGKTSLRNALINHKMRNKKKTSSKKVDLCASFRVNIDNTTNQWNLRSINKYDSADREKIKIKKYSSNQNLSNSFMSGSMESINYLNNKMTNSTLSEDVNRQLNGTGGTNLNKRRSSSTSYLNEEDDYGDDAKESSRKLKHRQTSLEDKIDGEDANNEAENIKKLSKQKSVESAEEENLNDSVFANQNSQKEDTGETSASSSTGSSEDDSEASDADENDYLYAIDEYDESIQTVDCDAIDLKKDPNGYYFKRIAMNIYQEIFTTKLFDKIWPTNNGSSNENDLESSLGSSLKHDIGGTLIKDSFTESFFEKLALLEFENSVYNQLSCSKILFAYYEQIVYSEMKLMRSKPSNTIIVNPLNRNYSCSNENLLAQVKNLKLINKKLSLTILDFAGQAHQIFLSSRAVYLVCFDLTKDLDAQSNSNFEFGVDKNVELTNLDYLDYLMRSIHSHTAKILDSADSSAANVNSSVNPSADSFNTIKIDDLKSISFKNATLSPPIIIVGTHENDLEKLPNKNETIRQKFDRIREFISTKIYAKHIVEPYFAIDLSNESVPQRHFDSNLSTEVDNHTNKMRYNSCETRPNHDIEVLKRMIELVASNEPYMGEQLPVKWMKFEKSLEKLKNKGLFYASLSQICEIAHEKDIKTQEELTTCLNFYHDLGAIIYYGNANDIFLRNTIILRPQKLVDIFNMVLGAQMPSSFTKPANMTNGISAEAINNGYNMYHSYDEKSVYGRQISHPIRYSSSYNVGLQWVDLWEKFDKRGILDDNLLDILWKSVINQKPGLLGLMKKFDLICERSVVGSKLNGENLNREYLVPSRARVNYDDEFEDMQNSRNNRKYKRNNTYDSEDDNDDDDLDDIEDLSEHKFRKQQSRFRMNPKNISTVEFYYDFCGFLPESLFHRIITRTARWTFMKSTANVETAVRMYFRKSRFYLDEFHDFVIEMMPLKYARIKIQVIRLSTSIGGFQSELSPPEPNACAKVRNFMETTLIDLRNLWMKRLMFNACVQCFCDKLCDIHRIQMCNNHKCMHFLNLDECLTNNIVTCDYRRVKTLIYKSWFPTQNISLHKGPVLAAVKSYSDKNMFYDENSLPNWVKNVAKLLQISGNKDLKEGQIITVHNENDWLALARLLGYTKSKINYFNESDSPALQLICDWIMSSDNTNLTIEFLLNYLEQIKREDVIKIINNEREKETVNSSVFISYQWDSQDEVIKIKYHLEKSGFNCFMDVGQIGGGNLLYQKIDQAIRNSKVVIACITPKFVVSHFCNREMALADLLRKPIVPIMLTSTPWPPPGGMSLIFSQLVYVDYFGVGGHGGCGIHADREQRNNEIVAMVSRHVNPSSYFLMNIDRITDYEHHQNTKPKRTFLDTLKPSQLIRGSHYYNRHDGFIDEVNPNRAYLNHLSQSQQSHHNRLQPHLISSRHIHGNDVINRTNSRMGQNNNGQTQASAVPKCVICNII